MSKHQIGIMAEKMKFRLEKSSWPIAARRDILRPAQLRHPTRPGGGPGNPAAPGQCYNSEERQ